MAATERITMTMRELDRFKVIQDVADGTLRPWRAAERLRLTTRQIRRLVARLREHGPEGLVSRRRSRPSNNQLDAVTADRALSIIRDRYVDFGPTLACEKLYECHGIRLAKETVRRLMTDAGLWVPRRQRPPKLYQPRARRACLGELIQIDGSDHRWFEERAPACSLLVYVDDATSQLMTLHFTQTESTFSYFEATRAYIERHGKPVAFYSDRYSVFRRTGANRDGNSATHFGRAMYELNIDTFCANSSPARRPSIERRGRGGNRRLIGIDGARAVRRRRVARVATHSDGCAGLCLRLAPSRCDHGVEIIATKEGPFFTGAELSGNERFHFFRRCCAGFRQQHRKRLQPR
jgi:transposase